MNRRYPSQAQVGGHGSGQRSHHIPWLRMSPSVSRWSSTELRGPIGTPVLSAITLVAVGVRSIAVRTWRAAGSRRTPGAARASETSEVTVGPGGLMAPEPRDSRDRPETAPRPARPDSGAGCDAGGHGRRSPRAARTSPAWRTGVRPSCKSWLVPADEALVIGPG